ncbi:MAG: hypothetical protein ABIQ58_02035 [Candidatus Limnocylindrales bacterium]
MSPPPPPPPDPPGLRAQFLATKDAAMGLAMAHLELAKAEASAIGGQIARAAGLIGLAVALVLMAGLLLVIGGALFLSDWLLGSMGWGVLHGLLLFTGLAVAAVLAAIGVPAGRLVRSFAVAAVIGIVVAVGLGLDAPNRLYTLIGDNLVPGVEAGVRPLVVGTFVGALLGLVAGVVMVLRLDSGGARVGALLGLAIVGALLGAFTAITFGPKVGIALGAATGYAAWTALMAADAARKGIDTDALKARFFPTQTIETSKETLEWLRRRMPPGFGS